MDRQNPDTLNFGGKWVILCTKGKSEGRQMSLGPTHQDTSPHARNWHSCHEVLGDRTACGDKQVPSIHCMHSFLLSARGTASGTGISLSSSLFPQNYLVSITAK